MKKFIKITGYLFSANLKIAIGYRFNLFAGFMSSILWMFLAVTGVLVLTYQADEIGGWNRYELFAVQGIYSIMLGLLYTFIFPNLKKLIRSIRLGDLDLILTKPVDSQFLVSVGEFQIYHLARLMSGSILLIFAISSLHIQMTLIQLSGVILFIFLGMIIIYNIWFILTTLGIWLINLHNLYELVVHLTGTVRYPLEMVRHVSNYLFFIILPLAVITSVPSQILVNKFNASLALSAIGVAISSMICARKFWFFALKYYTSASS